MDALDLRGAVEFLGGMDFSAMPARHSGFLVPGDAKALVKLVNAVGGSLILASQNRDSLKVFRNAATIENKFVSLKDDDFRAEWKGKDGKAHIEEFYYGQGFMSQSSRSWVIPQGADDAEMVSFSGSRRKVNR